MLNTGRDRLKIGPHDLQTVCVDDQSYVTIIGELAQMSREDF